MNKTLTVILLGCSIACSLLLVSSCPIPQEPTLYAITFDSNGGSAVPLQRVKESEQATRPADPTNRGYPFDDWYAEATFTTKWDFDTPITRDTILYANWIEPGIRDIGPSGGYIFYDKGEYTNGWRYLEAAPEDWSGLSYEPTFIFGYYRTTPTAENLILGTKSEIGFGKTNTNTLVTAMGEKAYSEEDGGSKRTYAAKVCLEYRGGGYTDWFLPSLHELNEMDSHLDDHGLGGFSSKKSYWSSSEHLVLSTDAYLEDFSSTTSGAQKLTDRYQFRYVRPVRAF